MILFSSIIVLGTIYALLGAGFVIVYRASRILNFAHAEVVMLSAYIAITVSGLISIQILGLFIVLFICFLLGSLVYFLLIRPLAGYSILSAIILTVAVGVVLQAISVLGWRGITEVIPISWRAYYSLPGGLRLSSAEIIAIALTIIFFVLLGSFYRFSRIGQQMRATAEKPLLSAQRGVRIYLISGLAWGIGFAAAGLAGILLGINYTVSLEMGGIAISAFVVALVGGMDSLLGTIPAAFIIAITERLTIAYVNPRLAETIPFVILLLVLIFKPWGLFGTEEELERV
ncbi:MAG: branched-chain amino acid ABC transporter permease [Thermodesulfobacteriota bacterium]|nr:branched-chain amino acid ABC transporter permease [Thermodesulfobacteriota bacterium]